MTNISVKKSTPPESKEVLAQAIVDISDGFNSLCRSGLNKKAVVILIQAETKLAKRDIELVLWSLPRLKGWYCS